MTERPIRPDSVEDPSEQPPADQPTEQEDGRIGVSEPSKLIRIASMTRALLDEARQAPLDEAGRVRLQKVHDRSLDELREILSSELLEEFDVMFEPLMGEAVPTEAELRVSQAQLIGWLEGLFHGIQASLMSQQMAAQAQLAEMQRRQQLTRGRPEDKPSGLYI